APPPRWRGGAGGAGGGAAGDSPPRGGAGGGIRGGRRAAGVPRRRPPQVRARLRHAGGTPRLDEARVTEDAGADAVPPPPARTAPTSGRERIDHAECVTLRRPISAIAAFMTELGGRILFTSG